MKHLHDAEEILPILRDIRKEMLHLAYRHNTVGKKNLAGWCIMTSYVLFHILKRRGYHPFVCKNQEHAFIKLDGWYIDDTCTQFNRDGEHGGVTYPAIYCKRKPADHYIHSVIDQTDNAKEIFGKLCRGWLQPVQLDNPVIRNLVENY